MIVGILSIQIKASPGIIYRPMTMFAQSTVMFNVIVCINQLKLAQSIILCGGCVYFPVAYGTALVYTGHNFRPSRIYGTPFDIYSVDIQANMSVKALRCSITWDLKIQNKYKKRVFKNNFKYIQKLQTLLKKPSNLRASALKHTQNHRCDAGQLPQEGTMTSRARAACKWRLYEFL